MWLKKHPTVDVIARDRGGLYADGASQGAPSAIQVADRFHLVVNLSCAIERVFEERSRELVLPASTPLAMPRPKFRRRRAPRRRCNFSDDSDLWIDTSR